MVCVRELHNVCVCVRTCGCACVCMCVHTYVLGLAVRLLLYYCAYDDISYVFLKSGYSCKIVILQKLLSLSVNIFRRGSRYRTVFTQGKFALAMAMTMSPAVKTPSLFWTDTGEWSCQCFDEYSSWATLGWQCLLETKEHFSFIQNAFTWIVTREKCGYSLSISQ